MGPSRSLLPSSPPSWTEGGEKRALARSGREEKKKEEEEEEEEGKEAERDIHRSSVGHSSLTRKPFDL